MDKPPFSLADELCNSLEVITVQATNTIQVIRKPAPQREGQEYGLPKDYLPGEPNIQLDNGTIRDNLKNELVTEELDQLSPHIWLMATAKSSSISPLAQQRVRGRKILITEQPRLHLVWYYETIFIKPLPKYLLSHAFWAYLVDPNSPIPEPQRSDLAKAARGFLRSYRYLIRRRSDFDLAMSDEHRLLPKKIKYADFIRLMRSLESIDDSMVSPRYHFGEVRLSRLNFWVKIFQRRFAYHNAHSQYNSYFTRFYGPILFVFGVFSVQLSAMQVALGALPFISDSPSSWVLFAKVSRGYSVFTLVVVVFVIFLLISAFAMLSFREIIFALKAMWRKRRLKRQYDALGAKSGGVAA